MIDVIAFDGDDTLWHNEPLFVLTQEKFDQLLGGYRQPTWTGQELYATEKRNLQYFGYGIKGFALSMIETAIELTDGRISGGEIQQIIDWIKEMLRTPVPLFDHAAEVIATLAGAYRLMLITKGDLFDQEAKIAQSGLAEYFAQIEIVSEKSAETYQALLKKHSIDPARFLMVGNSLRSDILPVVAIGGHAAYIPYHLTWAHEQVHDPSLKRDVFVELEHIGLVPAFVEQLNGTMSYEL